MVLPKQRGIGEVLDDFITAKGWTQGLETSRPRPLADGAREVTALVSGYFAARAGLVVLPDAPGVRNIQLEQLKTALPWAQHALALPPLDGAPAAD